MVSVDCVLTSIVAALATAPMMVPADENNPRLKLIERNVLRQFGARAEKNLGQRPHWHRH